MKRTIIGMSIVAMLCALQSSATPAVAAESELLMQFRLFLQSPPAWREDELAILESAVHASDPKLRALANERSRALGVKLPKNVKRMRMREPAVVNDVRLAFDLIDALESASQKELEQSNLTHAHLQSLLKAGRTQNLPRIFIASFERVPDDHVVAAAIEALQNAADR